MTEGVARAEIASQSQLRHAMPNSRSIQDLCCITQSTLLNACLSEADLRGLGTWDDRPNRLGFSPGVWCRAFLHKECQRDPRSARRLSDSLDLQYLDTVILVRDMNEGDLEEVVNMWVERPDGRALPGLLWALNTDPRDEVHELGTRLCHEAVTAAFRVLIGDSVSSTSEGRGA